MKLLAMNQRLVLLCMVVLLGLSCNKAGVGGKASISGVVKHHQVPITNAMVYIKYGADAFPGFELDQYDDQTTASAIDASFSFTNLHRGEYFIYCAGYDASIMEEVKGGVAVEINKKKENIVADVPVTE